MKSLFLEIPSLNRKQDVLDYLEENIQYGSDLNGIGSIDKFLDGMIYEEWLLELKKRENIEYVKKINRCLSKTFFVVRKNDNKIIGMINIRYHISGKMLKNGASHIGYGIRPTERKKGYAKVALYLALLEEQKLGETNVLLECDVDNIASNKTIQSLGGKLEKTELDSYDNTMTNYYWIDVNESLKKYFKQYHNKIENNIK